MLDWYCMCKGDGETTNHLLLHCTVARGLWNVVYWVMLIGDVVLLASWLGKVSRCSPIWSMIPYCLIWGIWRERDAQTFEGFMTLAFIHQDFL